MTTLLRALALALPTGFVASEATASANACDAPAFFILPDAQPVELPIPDYPDAAVEQGIEGSCELRVDADTTGAPVRVDASCTDDVFIASAERAGRGVRWPVAEECGAKVAVHGITYPIEYSLYSE